MSTEPDNVVYVDFRLPAVTADTENPFDEILAGCFPAGQVGTFHGDSRTSEGPSTKFSSIIQMITQARNPQPEDEGDNDA